MHDVPLLVESERGCEYAAVIVVEAPLEVRLDRLEARGVARDDARRADRLQATDEERRKVATWVVDNSGDSTRSTRQVDEIWTDLDAAERDEAAPADQPNAGTAAAGDSERNCLTPPVRSNGARFELVTPWSRPATSPRPSTRSGRGLENGDRFQTLLGITGPARASRSRT